MTAEVQYKPIEFHYSYKMLWGECETLTYTVAIGITIAITVNIVLALFRRKKDGNNKTKDSG